MDSIKNDQASIVARAYPILTTKQYPLKIHILEDGGERRLMPYL